MIAKHQAKILIKANHISILHIRMSDVTSETEVHFKIMYTRLMSELLRNKTGV